MTVPRRIQLVVNPATGDGRALAIARELRANLRARGQETSTLVAHDLASARAALARSREDFAALVCVGGDATLSEMATVALERRVPLVPVPAGFGNVFAEALGHRPGVPFVLSLLERGEVRWVDVGLAAETPFLANRGFGFLEEVQQAVERPGRVPRRRGLRYLAYVRAAVRALATAPLPALRVEADGDLLAEEAPMVVVANVLAYPGVLPLTPAATPFDGLLDVFVVPRMTKRRLLALLLARVVRGPGRADEALCRGAKHITVTSRDHGADRLEVLPHALPVLTSPLPGGIGASPMVA